MGLYILKLSACLLVFWALYVLLIEKQTQEEVIRIKENCDIYIDQIHNRGGWGYGMSSIESLSMGLVCMTEMIDKYRNFTFSKFFQRI